MRALALTAACMAGLILAAPTSAPAQNTEALAAEAAADLARAAEALDRADGARDRVAALTDTVRAYESGLAALRDSLRQGSVRERAIRAEFEAESDRLARLLSVLMSIRTSPEAQLHLHPAGPVETARAGMLIADVTPALRAEVARLDARLNELEDLQTLRRDAEASLTAGLEGIQTARTALSQAIADRAPLPGRASEDDATMRALINGVETLDAFAAGLAELDLADTVAAGQGFVDARGLLPLPVDGVVLRGFDEPDAAGIRRPGLVVAARPLALVTAPWPSTTRFSGPLLDYGNVIILEPEAGYLLVLAGLAEVYARPGEVVDAGAALGTMGGNAPDAGGVLVAAANGGGQDRSETLYMELRQDQTPEDPATWFLAGTEIGSTQ